MVSNYFFILSQRVLHSVQNIYFFLPTSTCHFFCLSVGRTPYLRNCTSSNHSFWYTCVKWYLQVFFFFLFLKFWFFGLLGGIKGQKKPKMRNNYICHPPYPRSSIAYHHDFWQTCAEWWYFQVCVYFFHFFETFTFWAVRAVKGQKIAQNEKQQLHPSCTIYLRNSIAYDHDFWYNFVKWWYLQVAFVAAAVLFQNFLQFSFFRLLGDKRAKSSSPQWKIKITSVSRRISGTV